MYLLNTRQVMDLLSRKDQRPVFAWLDGAEPADTDLFISVVSLGQIAHAIEDMEGTKRNQWRRLYQEGRRRLEDLGSVIEVDGAIVDVWQPDLRGDRLAGIDGAEEQFGEDDRLVIAKANARGYALVTDGDPVLEQIAERTTLTLIEL